MRQSLVRSIVTVTTAVAMLATPALVASVASADDATTADAAPGAAPAEDASTPADVPASDAGNKEFANTSIAGLFTKQAKDRFGYLPSLYTGKWYMPKKEKMRKCIILRESHANYRSTSSIYHGAYQMTAALGDGAAWMMQKEVRKELGRETGIKMMRELRRTPVEKWNRYWQDRAFWTIWRHGAGSHHWAGGSHSC